MNWDLMNTCVEDIDKDDDDDGDNVDDDNHDNYYRFKARHISRSPINKDYVHNVVANVSFSLNLVILVVLIIVDCAF